MLRKLTKNEYEVSAWSGGTTTQLAIFPPEAKYAERDFLWRVSSAAVALEESDFTALPDYDRLIATLQGEIVLTHNGGAPLRLRPFEVHAFSGADATHSQGRCTDFNLMLRRGRAKGSMEALRLTDRPVSLPSPSKGEWLLLYCVEGAAAARRADAEGAEAEPKAPVTPVVLSEGEALLLTEAAVLTLTGPAALMLCRMRTTS